MAVMSEPLQKNSVRIHFTELLKTCYESCSPHASRTGVVFFALSKTPLGGHHCDGFWISSKPKAHLSLVDSCLQVRRTWIQQPI